MIPFTNLTLKHGTQVLLENSQATINPGQKVGLVGKNGCGKSSLLSLIRGELASEEGDVTFPQHWAIAWVKQETPNVSASALDYVIEGDAEYMHFMAELAMANEENNGEKIAEIHGHLETIGAWTIQSRAATLLHGLGFSNEQLAAPVKSFSGGWRMRLNLAQALICRSDLLLLDEPTNHLDLDAVIWLERWLSQYKGTLLLISHDRDFIDPIVDRIIHIEQLKLHEYTGNYSSFEVQRATKLAQQNALYRQQQQKVAHLQHFIDRFKAKATKAKQAQSRIKALERMELIAPAHIDSPFTFQFREPLSLPNPLVSIDKLDFSYTDKLEILASVKLNLVPGSRIGLLGHNGAGKSTLIKLLAGELEATHGVVQLAKGVQLGYFAQHQLDTLRMDESPLWHMERLAPDQTEQQIRDYLGSFAFQGDKVKQAVKHFSGGEKARLVLALIVWQRPNLLLLDEPTNHLDLDMRQALTEALVDYQGSLVVVSHDRHLLRNTVDEFYLVHDKKVESFDGDLEDYQRWLIESQQSSSNSEALDISEEAPLDRKAQRRKEAELRQKTAPIRKRLTQGEVQMEKLEEKLAEIEEQLADTALYQDENKVLLSQLLHEQTESKKTLMVVEEKWMEDQQILEDILSAE